eukprot:Phypoly_transcript_11187.p1 GENE.Phypoly_transcript_11187~~Phypoly_transcript_11187.p1  ORF type:complete len:237 (+),score=32.03 Phypoly_transcript_11187:305-1015(+)
MSFITTMVASNFAEGNQTDLEVKGRNTGYFKYISQMYTQDSVELETNERKEDFLDEFSFWFPGEEQNAVQYKDIIVELRWKSLIANQEAAKNLIEKEIASTWGAMAKQGHFCTFFSMRVKELAIFTEVALLYNISVEYVGENEYKISWYSGPLYDLAMDFCKLCVKETWLALLQSAESSAREGDFTTKYKIQKNTYIFEQTPSVAFDLLKSYISSHTKMNFTLENNWGTLEFKWHK